MQLEGFFVSGGVMLGKARRGEETVTPRWIWAGMTLLSAAAVVYLSLIPMRYSPRTFAETVEVFRTIPWLEIGLLGRADWFSNGLVLIPFGFFAGAFTSPARSRNLFWFGLPLFLLVHGAFICAIEFTQVWFPPRVLSQNDMAAGFVGGTIGYLLWPVLGSYFVNTLRGFWIATPGMERISILAVCCAIGLCVYRLIPFDFVLSWDEWQQKRAAERITLVPFADWNGIGDIAKSIILRLWSFPLGMVLALNHDRRTAFRYMFFWCLAIELLPIFVYSRTTSITNLIVAGAVGVGGVLFCKQVQACLLLVDKSWTWLIATLMWSGVMVAAFCSRYSYVIRDREDYLIRLQTFWAIPFARAHRSSEQEALENILTKILVYALLMFLLRGWQTRLNSSISRIIIAAAAVIWTLTLGIGIEIVQAALPPLVPDVTDVILCCVGSVVGWMLFDVLIGPPVSLVKQ